ncbi:MAG: hypothetical protein JXX28_08770 [Deltaproteobacteria bacterium]|nr:hypothetical protein [Deltaproteobacteria bacterium]
MELQPLIAEALRVLHDDLLGAALISAALVLILTLSEVGRRWLALPPEWTRKGSHLSSGAVVLAFPWLVHHTATVVVLALSFFALLVLGRGGLLRSIHGVSRRTQGAYYYPFAVLMVWVLSGGAPSTYMVPLAIMAVSDTGAALVGQHTGLLPYKVLDGQRTAGGSLTFFLLALGIAVTGLLLLGSPLGAALLIGAITATLTTSVEAVSVRGADNLAVPYAAWVALDQTLGAGPEALQRWAVGLALGAAVVALSTAAARLSVTGAITVFAVTTLSWALGGAHWLLPPLGVYGLYLLTRPVETADLDQVFPTTAGPLVVLLASLHLPHTHLYGPFLAAVAASSAMTAVVVARARGWSVPLVTLLATLIPTGLGAMIRPDISWLIPLAGGALGVLLFDLLSTTPLVGRRLVGSLTAAAAAWWTLAG